MSLFHRGLVLAASLGAAAFLAACAGPGEPDLVSPTTTATPTTVGTPEPAPANDRQDATATATPPAGITPTSAPVEEERSTPRTATVNGYPLRLKVAETEEERRLGLSLRESITPDAAMLFVFPQEQYLAFWMKDVFFPIDLLYLDSHGVVISIHPMEVQQGVPDSSLRLYYSPRPAMYALELLGGMAEAYGIQPGMVVEFG